MATSKNFLPSDTNWLHELAKNELRPEDKNAFNALQELDSNQLIEESTIEVLELLQSLFNDYSRTLNSYSEAGSKFNDIKIYGITNTAADFMVFRNNVKMIFANTSHGLISISFNQHTRSDLVDSSSVARASTSNESGTEKFISQTKEIIAQVGPFLDIQWTFQGEKVQFEKLAKFYFVEFVRRSRITKKESQNQILLKQIKSLLQEKGIDL